MSQTRGTAMSESRVGGVSDRLVATHSRSAREAKRLRSEWTLPVLRERSSGELERIS